MRVLASWGGGPGFAPGAAGGGPSTKCAPRPFPARPHLPAGQGARGFPNGSIRRDLPPPPARGLRGRTHNLAGTLKVLAPGRCPLAPARRPAVSGDDLAVTTKGGVLLAPSGRGQGAAHPIMPKMLPAQRTTRSPTPAVLRLRNAESGHRA